ncbi:MAG: hypothetical protein GF334_13050 [Candidatus Altiarchaeales archaeon]|nr:hypothetical protein [Candidatus Altiarchaeales archaeon]
MIINILSVVVLIKQDVVLNVSSSLNGYFDPELDLFRNSLNLDRVHQLRINSDIILTSSKHVRLNDPLFKASARDFTARIVIVDPQAETPPASKVFKTCGKVTVAVSKQAPQSRLDKLMDSCDVEILPFGDLTVNLEGLLLDLAKRGKNRVLVEACAQLSSRLLNKKLVDELFHAVFPTIISTGYPVFADIEDAVGFELRGITQFGDILVNHYHVKP